MVNKIISGGQTGADQAALDVAIKLGIPHGGSIPKGRKTESGALDEKYKLTEMETSNYNKRTEQNVIDSDGTLIISRGKLTGGSDYTRERAIHHGRPFLHLDLNETFAFQAAEQIRSWISEQGIRILNVAGSRASKDPDIYQSTVDVLETAFYMDIVHSTIPEHSSINDRRHQDLEDKKFPQTVDQAVEKLLGKLSLRDKTMIANIPEENLLDLYNSLEENLQNELKLWLTRPELLASCRSEAGHGERDNIDAVSVIIAALWQKLQTTNVLRIIK
jgi:hypothetical protein